MLYCFSQLAHVEALIVSIDLPGAPNCGGQTATERRVFRSFSRQGQKMSFITRDSHLESTRRALMRVLRGRPIDLLFIDGDHSYAGVRADFELYSGLVSRSGLVAFHDILLHEDSWGPDAGVGDFWGELKRTRSHVEIVDRTGVTTPTLRKGEHWAWGIGVLGKTGGRPALDR